MRLVIIESPYKGDVIRNKRYLQACIRDCLRRSESPYASHQMLTDALDDGDVNQRVLGVNAGLAWRRAFFHTENGVRHVLPVFYLDLGWSGGMKDAHVLYEKEGVHYERRNLQSEDSFFIT